jgi:uncharacterized protein with HEPN domain
MRREVLKYLYDIQQACELLGTFTYRRTFEDYQSDAMLRSAVERQFGIIGEAMKQALRLDPGLVAVIRDTSHIIAFRNRLIHAYSQIAHDIVWGVIEGYLPSLHEDVSAVLTTCDPPPGH